MSGSSDAGDKRKGGRGTGAGHSKRQDHATTAPRPAFIDRNQLDTVKTLLNQVQRSPSLIHDPDLRFLKAFLYNFGATDLPPERDEGRSSSGGGASSGTEGHHRPGEVECEEDDYLEAWIDNNLMAPETLPFPPKGREQPYEPTEEDMDRAAQYKMRGSAALEGGRFAEAVEQFTLALQHLPSALLYARRAEALLQARRPSAALRDCDYALSLNPDSAKALKTRGKVNRAMGEWDRACQDLSQGLSIDYDEEASQLHKVCLERSQAVHEKRRAREQRDLSRRQTAQGPETLQEPSEFNSTVQAGDAANEDGLEGMMDPAMVTAMQNPRIFAAVQEMMRDPASAMKYTSDPEIAPVLMKMAGRGRQAAASAESEQTETEWMNTASSRSN